MSGWTDERTNDLKRYWREGLSASEIARKLGGVSRNGVIGKVNRLGLSGRDQPSSPVRSAPSKPAPRFDTPRTFALVPPRPPRADPRDAPTADDRAKAEQAARAAARAMAPQPHSETGAPVGVLTLGAHMCKWPIGDPGAADFAFCGRRSCVDGPYCKDHRRLAYQAEAKAKREGKELARELRKYL